MHLLTRRSFVVGLVGIFALGAAMPLARLWPRGEAVRMFIRLLGAWVGVAAIAESYCRQALACNEGQVERRLGEILQASGETPTTEQQALRRLIQLAKTEYSDGELIALDGWVLPESVVLANAYVHLKNL